MAMATTQPITAQQVGKLLKKSGLKKLLLKE